VDYSTEGATLQVSTKNSITSNGGKRRKVSQVRAKLSFQLSHEMGTPFAEIARHVGICTSAVAKAVQSLDKAEKK
jgi:hypothetical protein